MTEGSVNVLRSFKLSLLNLHGWGHETTGAANTAKSGMLEVFLEKDRPACLGCTETHFRDDFGPGSAFLEKIGYV